MKCDGHDGEKGSVKQAIGVDDQGGRLLWSRLEMCLQQRLQRLLVLKRNTSEITTTA